MFCHYDVPTLMGYNLELKDEQILFYSQFILIKVFVTATEVKLVPSLSKRKMLPVNGENYFLLSLPEWHA